MESIRLSIYKSLDERKSYSIKQELQEASMSAYFGLLHYNMGYTLWIELENHYIL